MRVFRDRYEAGAALAEALERHAALKDLIVLGLPRGGVPVAAEVARALGAPLDVMIVRKLGVPGHEELAMGAVASGGLVAVNSDVVEALGISNDVLTAAARRQRKELDRRERLYRHHRPRPPLAGRTVLCVDDGLATGSTMAAAIAAVRSEHPARIVVAVPVASADAARLIGELADEVVCLEVPEDFFAVGQWYDDFAPTTDEEVRELLLRSAERAEVAAAPAATAGSRGPATTTLPVSIAVEGTRIEGDLAVPPAPRGVVLFAHGSGSSRHSPRNRLVARVLERAGFATLLLDLLTEDEEEAERFSGALRFDVDLLARRVLQATEYVRAESRLAGLPIGYFGASTGAGAALVAAAQRPEGVAAVVSRGGRPDLAGAALPEVRAPTLLVVGGEDPVVVELNRDALAELQVDKRLEIVPGATHLFEEPGALERVAELARDWFDAHLASAAAEGPRARTPAP